MKPWPGFCSHGCAAFPTAANRWTWTTTALPCSPWKVIASPRFACSASPRRSSLRSLNSLMRLSHRSVLLALLLLLTGARRLLAAPTPEQLLQQGYDHFYNLEYDQALRDFEQLRRLEPTAPSVWNHIAQIMLYREMYRIGALESQLYGHGDPFLQEKLPPPSPQAEHDFEVNNDRALQL